MGSSRRELAAILAIAQRDLTKFLRDRARLIATFVFPFAFIGLVGGTFQASFGGTGSHNWLFFTFTGVYAQTLFQSSALGIISLLEDRENDFSQEIFIAPISRYSIVMGKILGESLVSMAQAIGIIAFAFIIGQRLTPGAILLLIPASLVICLFGGAFGIVVLGFMSSQRMAQQAFPFLILPQFFLSGVFNPVRNFSLPLDILSRVMPMRYAVDLGRDIMYLGRGDDTHVVLAPASVNLTVMAILFLAFMVIGTTMFVRQERNR